VAAACGAVDALACLANECGADVNERGHLLGVTPLMLAVALGHTAVVRLLLDGSSHFYTHVNVRANASVVLAALGAVSPGDGVAAAAAAGVAVDSRTMMRSRGDGVAAGVDVGGGGGGAAGAAAGGGGGGCGGGAAAGAGAAGGVGAVVTSACADSGSVMLTARDVVRRGLRDARWCSCWTRRCSSGVAGCGARRM
jgi:hypothetical protein